jgi:hypothetical protein
MVDIKQLSHEHLEEIKRLERHIKRSCRENSDKSNMPSKKDYKMFFSHANDDGAQYQQSWRNFL